MRPRRSRPPRPAASVEPAPRSPRRHRMTDARTRRFPRVRASPFVPKTASTCGTIACIRSLSCSARQPRTDQLHGRIRNFESLEVTDPAVRAPLGVVSDRARVDDQDGCVFGTMHDRVAGAGRTFGDVVRIGFVHLAAERFDVDRCQPALPRPFAFRFFAHDHVGCHVRVDRDATRHSAARGEEDDRVRPGRQIAVPASTQRSFRRPRRRPGADRRRGPRDDPRRAPRSRRCGRGRRSSEPLPANLRRAPGRSRP